MTPQELSSLSDEYWRTKQERLAADKTAASLKTKENGLKATLLKEMRENSLTAIGGGLVRLTLDPEPTYEPAIQDWQEYYDYILETKDFSLLQKRIGVAALKERRELSQETPGITWVQTWKLHESKV